MSSVLYLSAGRRRSDPDAVYLDDKDKERHRGVPTALSIVGPPEKDSHLRHVPDTADRLDRLFGDEVSSVHCHQGYINTFQE